MELLYKIENSIKRNDFWEFIQNDCNLNEGDFELLINEASNFNYIKNFMNEKV